MKSNFAFIVLILVLLEMTVGINVDMGQCSCNWANSPSQSVSSHFLSNSFESGKFYESLRGEKGEMGPSGRMGREGTAGTMGPIGLRGPPAADVTKDRRPGSYPISCKAVTEESSPSGIYYIKPDGYAKKFQVYCDTTTAGGGWTLVSSIHENNIYGKCTAGDNWSSNQGFHLYYNETSLNNWENLKTFGHPEGATSSDYKSEAYFSLPADNVMIWHVPNDVPISEWRSNATLIYYTNNNFLSSKGGTLQSLYSKYFPLKQQPDGVSSEIEAIAQMFRNSTPALRRLVPNFYSYNYDSTTNLFISDGGSDMYDTGNKVYYKIGYGFYKQIQYGKLYIDHDSGTQIYSQKTHPFITYMWIYNIDREVNSFSIKHGDYKVVYQKYIKFKFQNSQKIKSGQVESGTGADGSGRHTTESSTISRGNMTCKYQSYQVYSSSDPSICEVYFYCYSEQLWGSRPPSNWNRDPWSRSTDGLRNGLVLTGYPSSILQGYMLLSRTSGSLVSTSQIDAVIERMMDDLLTVTVFPKINCAREGSNDSLAVPVEYVVGSNETIMNDIPPNEKSNVVPGFIHFRPLDLGGTPNVICPGIQSQSCEPSVLCLGGIGVNATASTKEKLACGDFAGELV